MRGGRVGRASANQASAMRGVLRGAVQANMLSDLAKIDARVPFDGAVRVRLCPTGSRRGVGLVGRLQARGRSVFPGVCGRDALRGGASGGGRRTGRVTMFRFDSRRRPGGTNVMVEWLLGTCSWLIADAFEAGVGVCGR